MNRHARRAARATARDQAVDRTVAVHEAGHVVGRILVSGLLGWSPTEIVSHVDVYPVPLAASGTSLDGTRAMHTQATTYGQMLSRPMHEFLSARDANKVFEEGTDAEKTRFCAEMREAGIDLDAWCLAKCIVCVFGPMAEAKLTGRSFDEVLNDYSSENDVQDAARHCHWCGMTPEQTEAMVGRAITGAGESIADHAVWAAILALADELRPGRTQGYRAVQIATRAFEQAARDRVPGAA